ncbi:top2 [Ecytonucleospora hepatopenaei]|uniref:DNA topoisomerase 2 n=1 Tax=Ecytonucleospora hepatopenaei TaxID=646526 RepID=A0A1W0E6G6_9MICR|nr:top2 [Ecytonucleospora hepatopenaei]
MTKTVEETYQKKTPKEHILLRPDTYIGSVEMDTQQMFVWDCINNRIVHKHVTFVPGLYKIFDEILVNAADNKQRDKKMSYIKVNIDDKRISIKNNGQGIPIKIHAKEKVYVPELIFGHLLTSSNYDDKEKKVTGGRNGYGAKLCNIFSSEFTVETVSNNQKYVQIFKNNMSIIGDPLISTCDSADYTKITFVPDFTRFNMKCLDADILSIFYKRVYDLCATVKGIKVWLNDEKLNICGLKDYAKLCLPKDAQMVSKEVNQRWELVCAVAEDQFTQISFVNSICTSKGGTHVNHVLDQLIEPLTNAAKKKDKTLVLKPLTIKNSLFLFVNCLIENPAFDSQTKENLTLKTSSFGSKCTPIDDFVKDIIKNTEIIDKIIAFGRAKQATLLKKTDGTKTTKLTGIPKLEDANWAGTKKSSECTLILTEGDSAKTLAVAGLSVVGRDKYGVFPLRGKLLNVREAANKQIMENAEISAIKKILGLQHGKTYSDTSTLRYGHIMIMTDQDFDGSHIKGLIINFLDHFFPSLLKINGFLQEFITPIVRATKKNRKLDFFTVPEYEEFKNDIEARNSKGWTIKYYKGLGTSTAADAKQYFSNLDLHVKTFSPLFDDDKQLVDLAFNKKKADERKTWLGAFEPGTFLDQAQEIISIKDFVNKELILFSMADNIRSIPSVIDGLKPGQRKVIFSCFKRNLRNEIKVAQLVGYVSEHSAYHHGEASLSSTIINLAHDFVGSNNINLLLPIGQFGSRLLGGKDSASPRYIFTNLNPLTRLLFHEHDIPVLQEQTEDNMKIEPVYYVPILPLVLINGTEGIGTGWSTAIPNYNVMDLIKNIKLLMQGHEPEEMIPFYKNWRGEIIKRDVHKFDVYGKAYKLADDKTNVVELPVGTWTQGFKEQLDILQTKGEIKGFKDYSTDKTVDLIISCGEKFKEKLTSSISTSNMVCFDSNGKIKKYSSTTEILKEFYTVRLEHYDKRKRHRLGVLEHDLEKLRNKVRFIRKVVDGSLVVSRKQTEQLIEEMKQLKFKMFDDSFDYLLDMKISSLTKERIEKLNSEYVEKEQEHNILKGKTIKELWIEDLDVFEREYRVVIEKEAREYAKDINKKSKTGKQISEIDLSLYKKKNTSKINLKVSDTTKKTKVEKVNSELKKKNLSSKIKKLDLSSMDNNK